MLGKLEEHPIRTDKAIRFLYRKLSLKQRPILVGVGEKSALAGEFPRYWATGHQNNLSSIKIIGATKIRLTFCLVQLVQPRERSFQDVISFNAALTAEDPLAPWRRAAELLRRLRACGAAAGGWDHFHGISMDFMEDFLS